MKELVNKKVAETESDGSVKITITKEAAAYLKELMSRVNDGFEAGQVHRQDIASWIISKFAKNSTDQDIHEIQISHYNDSAMLDSLYRRMKETGEVPEFLRDVLRKQFSGGDSTKKAKKSLGKGYTSDVPMRNEDAS